MFFSTHVLACRAVGPVEPGDGQAIEQNIERRNFGGFVGFVVLMFIWYPALYFGVRP